MKKLRNISKLRIISVVLIIFCAIGILAGCTGTGSNQSQATSESSNIQQSKPSQTADTANTGNLQGDVSGYPVTLTDMGGAQVTITRKPSKMVVMPLGSCEMLLSFVNKSSIAAMTNYVDDTNVSNVADEAKGVGQRVESNAEKIIALNPDLVLVDTSANKEFVSQLRDAKLTVFVLNIPSNIDQEKEILKLLGKITGEVTKADEIINWMDTKLKGVSDKLSGLKEAEKLTILDYSEMSSTSGKDTNFDDLVTRAGLINPVSKDGLKGWPQLSKEMVVKYNPDIISLPSWCYDKNVSYDSLSKSIKGDKALAGVKAVKNNKLIALPYKHITTISQYSVLGVEDLARAAYPELFK